MISSTRRPPLCIGLFAPGRGVPGQCVRGGQYASALRFSFRCCFYRHRTGSARISLDAHSELAAGSPTDGDLVCRAFCLGNLGDPHSQALGAALASRLGSDPGPGCGPIRSFRRQHAHATLRRFALDRTARRGRGGDGGDLLFALDVGSRSVSLPQRATASGIIRSGLSALQAVRTARLAGNGASPASFGSRQASRLRKASEAGRARFAYRRKRAIGLITMVRRIQGRRVPSRYTGSIRLMATFRKTILSG